MGTEVIAWIPELPTAPGGEPAVDWESRPAARAEPVVAVVTVVTPAPSGMPDPHVASPCPAVERQDRHGAGGRESRHASPRVIAAAAAVAPAAPAPAAAPVPSPAPAAAADAGQASSRGPSRAARFPSGSIVLLALTSAAVWGLAWRNELLRLEAQRRGPERLALEPSGGPDATRSIRP